MESECGVECGGCLSTFAQAQILAQERTVVGVGAILDNRVGALFGVFRTKVGDALVGSVRARLAEQTCLVGRLFVEPLHQRQGIGGALLAAIEAQFASAAVFELFTGSRSESNIRLYRRHGYAIAATERLTDQVDIVVMRKPAGGVAG